MSNIDISNITKKRDRNNKTTLYVGQNIIGRIVYSTLATRSDPDKYVAYFTLSDPMCIGKYFSEENAEKAVYAAFETWIKRLEL